MKLSVLITFYNQEKYVDRALSSIISQNVNFDYEILIGDDGSTDQTLDKVKEWINKYPDKIKFFIMNRDITKKYNSIFRVSKNRINLITQAIGEYCIFLDGDDFYCDNTKIQTQVDILDKPENSNCSICAHNFNNFYEDTNETSPGFDIHIKEKIISSKKYWSSYYIHPSALLFRNIFNGNFPKNFNTKYFDDNLITFYLIQFGSVYYIPKIFSNYNITKAGTWGSKPEIEQHILNLLDYDIELQISKKLKKSSLIRHFYNFKYLYKNRMNLQKDIVNTYLNQAKDDNCKNVINLLTYSNSHLFKKLMITINYYILKFQYNYYRKNIT